MSPTPHRDFERIEKSGSDDAGARRRRRCSLDARRAGRRSPPRAPGRRGSGCRNSASERGPTSYSPENRPSRLEVAVSSSSSHSAPQVVAGARKVIGSWCAFIRTSRPSSTRRRAALVDHPDRVAAEHERERGDPGLLPVLGRHLAAVGPQPGEVLELRVPDEVAHQEAPALQARVLAAQRDEAAREVEQAAAAVVERPVEPGELVVLAVGVVVAALGAAHLVAAQQHRDALRQQQRRPAGSASGARAAR